jgi:hypothetical protein
MLLLALGAMRCSAHSHAISEEKRWGMGSRRLLRLGAPFRTEKTTPLEDITTQPGRYRDTLVRTRGKIDSVCNQEGCWIDLVPFSGGAPGVLVNPLGKAFSFPVDCSGRSAEVEGRFFVQSYPESKLRHWSHHGWRKDRVIDGPMSVHRIEATAVEIR